MASNTAGKKHVENCKPEIIPPHRCLPTAEFDLFLWTAVLPQPCFSKYELIHTFVAKAFMYSVA